MSFLKNSGLKIWWGVLPLFFINPLFSQQVRLLFTGDVLLAHHFEYYVKQRITYPFDKIPWFKEADVSVINLEAPFTSSDSAMEKPYVFKAKPKYVEVLKYGGVDLVNLANNHIYDYGKEGLLETLETLERAGLAFIGAGRNINQARKPAIFEIKGLKLAFMGYYGLRAHEESHPATETEPGTALRKLKYIKEDIKQLKDRVDFITVIFHWGQEKKNIPEADQIRFAHRVIDYGADLIVGHHPHVLQGVEKYKKGVIVYSLGNFIFGGNSRTYEETAVLQVNIPVQNPEAWSVKMLPVAVRYWQPALLEGARRDSVLKHLKEYSEIFEQTPLN
ncbi:Capsule synthesis protein, CapA [Caldithrix abyssi DSM 13497]|uniref:Capsule synthesis protein, CapA n=1 Tax=Caldithrix abyssi DSM 13497 TaxID=880073 RepID=H1XY67_CALAY|nr:CapA family protein [Caldithrix abyssi]EHO41994.1 Capsule synthesis protein, CapA [Caldithrix abyssi DSM 13497]